MNLRPTLLLCVTIGALTPQLAVNSPTGDGELALPMAQLGDAVTASHWKQKLKK